jgi:predicted alpha/beta hydrolase family esterase
MPFPTLIIASLDCPYGSPGYTRRQADMWRAGYIVTGNLGHINEASGLGDWPQGLALLEAFRTGLGR